MVASPSPVSGAGTLGEATVAGAPSWLRAVGNAGFADGLLEAEEAELLILCRPGKGAAGTFNSKAPNALAAAARLPLFANISASAAVAVLVVFMGSPVGSLFAVLLALELEDASGGADVLLR